MAFLVNDRNGHPGNAGDSRRRAKASAFDQGPHDCCAFRCAQLVHTRHLCMLVKGSVNYFVML